MAIKACSSVFCRKVILILMDSLGTPNAAPRMSAVDCLRACETSPTAAATHSSMNRSTRRVKIRASSVVAGKKKYFGSNR